MVVRALRVSNSCSFIGAIIVARPIAWPHLQTVLRKETHP